MSDIDPSAPRVRVGTAAAGHSQESPAHCKIPLKGIPSNLFAHTMPGSQHSLLGIGIMCDKDCNVLFTKRRVIIHDKDGKPFLNEWRELTGLKPWHVSLQSKLESAEPCPPNDANLLQEATLEAYSVYNLLSTEALMRYFHEAAGYPIRDTWLKAIKAGNYTT